MDSIKDIWVSQERAKAGFRTEIDRPAAIFDAWKISWIRVVEFSPTESDEERILLLFQRMFRHLKNNNIQAAGDGGSSIE